MERIANVEDGQVFELPCEDKIKIVYIRQNGTSSRCSTNVNGGTDGFGSHRIYISHESIQPLIDLLQAIQRKINGAG